MEPFSLSDGISTSTLSPFIFTYARLENSNLISTTSSPVHVVTNTYEPNRDILLSLSTPTYDLDGNMLTDGTGKLYTWDCENRITQVTLSNGKLNQIRQFQLLRSVTSV